MLNAVPFRKESICLARNETPPPKERELGEVRNPWKNSGCMFEDKSEVPYHAFKVRGLTSSGENSTLSQFEKHAEPEKLDALVIAGKFETIAQRVAFLWGRSESPQYESWPGGIESDHR